MSKNNNLPETIPTLSPPPGMYDCILNVSLNLPSNAPEGARIRYTVNHPEIAGASFYTGPIMINTNATIRAWIDVDEVMVSSEPSVFTYLIRLPEPYTITATPPAGTYTDTQALNLTTTTDGAEIWYTHDDMSAPQQFTKAINIDKTAVIWAHLRIDGKQAGPAFPFVYTIRTKPLAAPNIPAAFIRTAGTKFVDGNGNNFHFKGWGLWAGNPATPAGTPDFTERTYAAFSDIGINGVRLYFGSNMFETVPTGGETFCGYNMEAFKWLNKHIEWARANDMKIIMNMHHMPGDETIGGRGLFSHPDRANRFVALWKAIAEWVADEPVILGFDLVNEPHFNVHITRERDSAPYILAFQIYENLVQRTIDAMREVNTNHVMIVERLWIENSANAFHNAIPNDQHCRWQNLNGTFNFPAIDDFNYALTWHCYEPRFLHQTVPPEDNDHTGGPNRVYPDPTAVAKYNSMFYGDRWYRTKEFLEYVYLIPFEYVTVTRGVPAFIGEFGIHIGNFRENELGVYRGGSYFIRDIFEIFHRHGIHYSFHPFFVTEFHPTFDVYLEAALREALGTS